MDFSNKNVLITGGSRGIGKAAAKAFAEGGARVAINFRTNKAAAEATLAELPGKGHFALQADLTKPEEVAALLEEAIVRFGQLHIVVNNAGIFKAHPVTEVDYGSWQKGWEETIHTNLIGPANVCYLAAQHMIAKGGGRIVNVSSRGAFRGEPGQPAYGASKAGLNAMSQSLAQALAPYNIFVGLVAPGFTETDMAKTRINDDIRNQSPLKRVAQPEEVAYGILFLASEGAEFMTGAILDINRASYLRS